MATRAVYSFIGFQEPPVRHLYLHHDGYPTGAAWRFQTALQHCLRPAEFLASFQSTQPGLIALVGPEVVADAEYSYRVEYCGAPIPGLQVQAWRRLPVGDGWMLRCGPMPLAQFIRRFLPGELTV